MAIKSSKDNLVSVIMNCFNAEKFIELSIKSVLAQTYTNWELIIWDNCSKDNTSEIIGKFNDKRILYFKSNLHLSLGAARNEALKKTNGKFISFLDSDDIWLSKKLEIQVNYFEQNKKIKFIYSDYYIIDENGKRVFKLNLGKNPSGIIFTNILKKNVPALLTVFFESSFIKKEENLFDPNLELVEEFEFFTRLLREYEAGYLSKPLAEYRVHPKMTSKTSYSKYSGEIDYVIKKLKLNCSSNEYKTKSAIRYLECKNIYYKANQLMISKDGRSASKLLSEVKFQSLIFMSLYLLSLFNYRVWNKFHKILNRY